MFVSSDDMALLTRLRRQQGHGDSDNWQEAFDLADTSIHGALHHAKQCGFPVPEIGYEIVDDRGAVADSMEAAWPNRKIGIIIRDQHDIPGWKIYDTIAFLERY